MGKTLVIYAHPHTAGHCPAIKEEVERLLKEHKVEYSLFDLYAMNYDPLLHENEHYTAGAEHRDISEQNKMFQQKIAEADKLIFIYPIWWNSMPAVLKGWLDRVLTSHFAFKFDPYGIPVKLLKGRRALLFITGGTNRCLAWIFLRDRAAKIMAKDTLGFCGIKTTVCQFGSCRKFTEERATKIRKVVKRKLSSFYGW
jgi:NAD(P)H dehydrogenase (quinone)